MLNVLGTPDVNGDTVPDLWAVRADGSVRFYAGGKASVVPGSGREVLSAKSYWKNRIAVG
ncbi:hypothetical protein [Streptomyces graminilatus]|uniref:hypothetical protein n=1 Tax=Streptomyces graminilatus TaxID=1464070 RepID=UPI000AFBFA84|nr:hypothetical protein [Streptomyces graminilatus]